MFHPEASEEDREAIQGRLTEILQMQDDIEFAYLHGSFLDSMYRDVDVAVMLRTPVAEGDPLDRCLRLSEELTRALDAGVEVDVRALNDAPLPFRFEALRKGRLILSRNERLRVEHETRTIQAFHDFQHHFQRYGREILGAGT